MARVLPLTMTSSASRGASGLSPTAHSHADSSKHSSYESSRRRLQPIGADAVAKPRSSDKTLNGIKRSSLVLESGGSKDVTKQGLTRQTSHEGSKDAAKQAGMTRQTSHEGKRSSASSISSADQSSKDAVAQNKLLPRLV